MALFWGCPEFLYYTEFEYKILHDISTGSKVIGISKIQDGGHLSFWNFRLNTRFPNASEFWFCAELAYQTWYDYLNSQKLQAYLEADP